MKIHLEFAAMQISKPESNLEPLVEENAENDSETNDKPEATEDESVVDEVAVVNETREDTAAVTKPDLETGQSTESSPDKANPNNASGEVAKQADDQNVTNMVNGGETTVNDEKEGLSDDTNLTEGKGLFCYCF